MEIEEEMGHENLPLRKFEMKCFGRKFCSVA